MKGFAALVFLNKAAQSKFTTQNCPEECTRDVANTAAVCRRED